MQFGFEKIQERIRTPRQPQWMPSLCKQRLKGYADSIMELSKELNITEITRGSDRQSILEERIFSEKRDLLCDSLKTIAGLMENVAEEITSCKTLEEKKKKQIVNALKEEGIFVSDIYYLPRVKNIYRIGIEMRTMTSESVSVQKVSDMISVLLNRDLQPSVSDPERIDENERVFIFVDEAPNIVMTGFSRITKNSETVSGDNYSIMESENGMIDILISDGTGSGREAFENSQKAIELLEKMIETGYDRDVAIKMLNTAFCAIEQERNHPTIDMCSIDLYDGSCEIRKSGAAATFIKRGMDVEILSGISLPLGISRDAKTVRLDRQLKNGDFVVMMTDGALEALNEHEYEETMQKIISTVTEQNPDGIAERVLQTVLCLDGGRILDDMTVLVAGFWKDSRKNIS